MTSMAGKTVLISGGSRGIGLAIVLRVARDGANIVMLAKTSEPHPRLPGTVHTAVADVEAAGGHGIAVVGDVRRDDDVQRAVDTAVEHFGGIDVVLNNASALDLRPAREIPIKSYDLMQDINARGTFVLAKLAIPHPGKSDRPHIPTLSPPIDLRPQWAGSCLAYTMAKYGMISRSRTPGIMSDAAYAVLTRDRASCSGNFFLDEEVLTQEGVTELDRYRVVPGGPPLEADLFLDPMETGR